MTIKETFEKHVFTLQDQICKGLEKSDERGIFIEDQWNREGGGGGKTRVINNGKVIEKGGVNVSVVFGELPHLFQKKFNVEQATFYACGLSLVIHPISPKVPTVHANWRYFEMYDQNQNITKSWFGGGTDLTPYYLDEDDAKHFHLVNKSICDKHHPSYYKTFKKECDNYFFNTHRKEARGIGGIFFDYLEGTSETMQFTIDSGNSFLDAYTPIVEKHKNEEYSQQQKIWQEIRRGRYVEFNLLHDRGTHFGIKTNGRTESILMSLPSTVRWEYNHKPKEDSPEENLLNVLQNPKEWV